MDEQLILETAAASAPALRALAREILQAEAAHLGMSLNAADASCAGAGACLPCKWPRRLTSCSSTWLLSKGLLQSTMASLRSSRVPRATANERDRAGGER